MKKLMNKLHKFLKVISQKPDNFSHLLYKPHDCRLFASTHSKDNLDYDSELKYIDAKHSDNGEINQTYVVKIIIRNYHSQPEIVKIALYTAKSSWDALRLAQYDLHSNESIASVDLL